LQKRSNELLWALVAVFLISLLYTGVVFRLGSVPAARSFFGHSLGIIGFLLMVTTELGYSLRKRSRSARWGRMASWLQFHIFTGIVGPFLVLLHTAWKLNGLAGIVLLLTAVIVASGFIGRYIYTAVPRTADGAEIAAREIGERIRLVEGEIAEWTAQHPPVSQTLQQQLATLPSLRSNSPAIVFERFFTEMNYRIEFWREQRQLDLELREQEAVIARLARERRALHRQMASLAAARRLLAVWHAVHIPIGMALFISAAIHIVAAVYYATLIH
jgi:hypothetical protein